ncbi:cytochrome-c peroxidase [Phaeocystidibacter luteus]|uniref:Cytochrome-c peroxidase n=1 Tax=Phaeocystidibacter luteus TaxID=911197 RepID=A0A6N6RE66_9FLAO|nr:cytochrome c peroxidase [Phaeocystidibacter luteus]KAB2808037.1 cytochrome-c peroxidase [Phaeocystidibacter luteus]
MKRVLIIPLALSILACQPEDEQPVDNANPNQYAGIEAALNIDPENLPDYVNQQFPAFYDNDVFARFDNTPANNMITNEGATLGRVLFYDEELSFNGTVSCASCHTPNDAFSDPDQFSTGFEGGLTDVHSMRLANSRFYEGESFFWDKRAATLEAQTTQPIQNEVEMGFDASNGGIAALIAKMEDLDYYPELFELAFGDDQITEARMQFAMAQFIRSMISVNSKFDAGYAQVYNLNAPGNGIRADFPNFTAQENTGKGLFLDPPNAGGAGCAGCHVPPVFTLDVASRSNGLDAGETVVFKSPSLKTVEDGQHFMHDGRFSTLLEVVEHYDNGVLDGPALDNRLRPGGQPQQLNLTQVEKNALVAFLETLGDNTLMTDSKYGDPFK